jgi:hypothetical protein
MRITSLILFFCLAVPSVAQTQGGHETVQDAIRFERQKDAAAARQARIESRRSSADRSAEKGNKAARSGKMRKSRSGSAARTSESPHPQQ